MADATCTVEDCEEPVRHKRLGLCEKHYYRWYRTGSTDDPRPSPEQRFYAGIRETPTGCWRWGPGSTHGYSQFYADGRYHLVHRWAYEHFIGPIPEGMTVDHRCHNENSGCAGGSACLHRRCANPQHLKLATGSANTSRGVKSWQTHCKRGHEFTEANTYMTPKGQRVCRTCLAARKRAWRKRHSGD